MINYDPAYVSLTAEIPSLAREWRNQRCIFKWCRQSSLITIADHEAWLEKLKTDRSIKMFGVNAGNVAVGVCGFTSIDQQNQKAEFSLYISKEHQHHSYGKEALYTLCRHGFEDLNLWRIWGETFENNLARKMFEKIGFKNEGVLKDSYYIEGRRINSLIYGVTRDDFRKHFNYFDDTDLCASNCNDIFDSKNP